MASGNKSREYGLKILAGDELEEYNKKHGKSKKSPLPVIDGYTFDDSEAVIDGKFIGLPLDDINEDDKTDTRIEAWIAAISSKL